MQKLLEMLVLNNRLTELDAERCRSQFDELVSNSKTKLERISKSETRKTIVWIISIRNCSLNGTKELHSVINDVLILSHGNAHVESGFSINKNMLVENLLEESLVNLR